MIFMFSVATFKLDFVDSSGIKRYRIKKKLRGCVYVCAKHIVVIKVFL